MGTKASILLALALLTAPGCWAPKVSEAQAVVPELKLEGVRFRVYGGDELRVLGVADTTTLRRDSADVRAERLDATLPRGTAPLRITAPIGEGSLLSRVFAVSGGVVAARGDAVARTARARYEPGADGKHGPIVRGEDPVVVEAPAYRLEGTGFTLDPSAGEVVMSGGARLLAGLSEAPGP